MSRTALAGGTGPTGPYVLQRLPDQGPHPIEQIKTYTGFADRFDAALEDTLISQWRRCVNEVLAAPPHEVSDEVHPMPHPRKFNQPVDDRGR